MDDNDSQPSKVDDQTSRRRLPSMRTMSFNADALRIKRTRSKSECTNDSTMYDSDDNVSHQQHYRHTASDTTNNTLRRTRTGTFSSLLSGVQRRATSLIFSDAITRKYEENLMSMSLQDIDLESSKDETESEVIDQTNQDNSPVTRAVSQTDYLNRRLLDSFLSRINSMSSAIVDPTSEGNREVYTDDLLMDRILHRVENDADQ